MKLRFLPILGFMAVMLLQSCGDNSTTETPEQLANEFDCKVVTDWNGLIPEIERVTPKFRPPIAIRALAYVNFAAYESAIDGMPNHNSMATLYPNLAIPARQAGELYHWPAVVNACYEYMVLHLYPAPAEALLKATKLSDDLEERYRGETTTAIIDRSVAYGQAVAQAVYEWSKTDEVGFNYYPNIQPADYIPPTGAGKWQPTFPDFSAALLPKWGDVRMFAARPEDRIGKAPIAFSEEPTSLFYQQAYEVYNYSPEPGSEGEWMAEFWSDDIATLTFSPPTRLVTTATQVCAQEHPDLETALELYAKLCMALHDAGVICWHTKYLYNVERPASYIRRVIDPNWTSSLNNPITGVNGITPPFPAYPSGHSTFAGAGAAILTDFFGNYAFTDRIHEDRSEFRGAPRSFNSFYEAGYENAISRIYLGVHYRMDCDEGIRLGLVAANRVQNLPWTK